MNSAWFVYVTIILVAIIQIPIAIDLLRFFFPQWRVSRLASQLVHTILFICMAMIFCIAVSYHLFVYLPLIAPNSLQTLKGWLHLTFALWLWINMIGNYYYVVSTVPGDSKSSNPKRTEGRSNASIEVKDINNRSNLENRSKQSKVSTTKSALRNRSETETVSVKDKNDLKLNKMKITNGLDWHPRETRYCKICECVVPHIDHHCPFTGCCAGLYNYSYFFIGLCYGTVGLFYAVAITLPYFFDCNLKNVLWYFGLIQNRVPNLQCADLGPHTHIFLPVFVGFILIANLLFLQIVFLLSDLSTYNVLTYWSKYPILRFMWHRISAGKFLEQNSRLRMLVLNQRPNLLWFLVPVSNSSQTNTTTN